MKPSIPEAKSTGFLKYLETCNTKDFVWLISGYVALHFLLRILFSPVIGTDDVTQAIYAQTLALGYEFRQPPLYTWLQWCCDQLIGIGVYSHIFLKYLLLFTTYLFLYLIGRIIFVRHSTAVIASLSLWLTFPFAVSIHQGVTHSILLCALIAISVYAFLRLDRERSLPGYIGLGVWLGLGMFSKYGFILFAVAFVLAALSLPRFRRVLLDPRILATMAIVLLISIPPLSWLIEQQTGVTRAVSALGPEGGRVALANLRMANLVSLVSSIVQFLSPLWLFLLIFSPKAFRGLNHKTIHSHSHEYMQLLGRTIFISLSMVVLAMILGILGKVQPRWMHAFLLLFPLYFFARAEHAYPDGVTRTGYLSILTAIPLIIIGLWAGQTYLGPSIGKATRFHAPYDLLADHLHGEKLSPSLIIAGDEYLAGNLRLGFPESRVITPNFPFRLPVENTGTCLLIWQTDNSKELPAKMEPFISSQGGALVAGVRLWKQNYRFSSKKFLEVGYLSLPIGDCRAH
jgi:hypothetical protein